MMFLYILADNKCVGFNTLGKAGGRRTLGSFSGASKMLERTAFRGALNTMIDNLNDKKKLKSINHDDDNLYGKIMQELKDIIELHDVGHNKKNLGNKFNDFKSQTQKDMHRKRLFSGIKRHLLA